jgi:plasmid stabilization system protein ParE
MALRIEYEQEALEDLVAAGREAREKFGSETAERLLDRIHGVVDLLATQPEMGHNTAIPTHPRLGKFQFFPLSDFPYLVFFTHDDQTLRVYGVVYAAMDLPRIFRERWEREN